MCLRHPKVFPSVPNVDYLDGAGEVLGGDVPDPLRAIAQHYLHRSCGCRQRLPEADGSLLGRLPAGSFRPFFFLRCKSLLDGTQSADLLTDSDELMAEFLVAAELSNVLLGFAYRRRSRQGLGYSLPA